MSKNKNLVSIALVALLILVGVLEAKRRAVESQLEQVTVRLEQLQGGNTAQNQAEADRIIRKVRRLIDINEEVTPTVATIVDVNALRQRNPFYEKADNGDFLIVTPERAILYNESRNVILDVVPVQLTPNQQPAEAVAE